MAPPARPDEEPQYEAVAEVGIPIIRVQSRDSLDGDGYLKPSHRPAS